MLPSYLLHSIIWYIQNPVAVYCFRLVSYFCLFTWYYYTSFKTATVTIAFIDIMLIVLSAQTWWCGAVGTTSRALDTREPPIRCSYHYRNAPYSPNPLYSYTHTHPIGCSRYRSPLVSRHTVSVCKGCWCHLAACICWWRDERNIRYPFRQTQSIFAYPNNLI